MSKSRRGKASFAATRPYDESGNSSLSPGMTRNLQRLIMSKAQRHIGRERKTIEAMISLYCCDKHGTSGSLCPECGALLDYALKRLDRCPFKEAKPTCANCTIHCYKPEMREKVRAVMRYAGPRMTKPHPVLSLFHFIDGRRKTPERHRPKHSGSR